MNYTSDGSCVSLVARETQTVRGGGRGREWFDLVNVVMRETVYHEELAIELQRLIDSLPTLFS